jgi:hypothetical protein
MVLKDWQFFPFLGHFFGSILHYFYKKIQSFPTFFVAIMWKFSPIYFFNWNYLLYEMNSNFILFLQVWPSSHVKEISCVLHVDTTWTSSKHKSHSHFETIPHRHPWTTKVTSIQSVDLCVLEFKILQLLL